MKSKRLLVLSPLSETLIKGLLDSMGGEPVEEIEVSTYGESVVGTLKEAVKGANVILGDYTFKNELETEVIEAARGCKLIQQPSAGYQHIDIEAAAECGIPVANVAGANAVSVAEHTVMLVLACLKKLLLAHRKTSQGDWAQDEMANYGVFELYGKNLGIIGAGRIGTEVAKRLSPFGCNLLYYDPVRLPPEKEEELQVHYSELDSLIAKSDVITIHAPLTADTLHLINRQRIACMKPNCILVNVARGEIVDEEALSGALKEGRIGGAGIDVFSSEPISADNPLADSPNVVLSPHIAGATNESRLRIISFCIENVLRVFSGERPLNVVNGV